ncbi:hypothetical protein C2G38_2037778 [Gigaspora rosea]|uniref:Uncharacterized protein n=1 Tax=Gigaspora rosea TaxID=44941 RepID=A0A397V6X4_9GLOM|nr:hypothetical protein C2G38_2037778 [Gigaspora rosea]
MYNTNKYVLHNNNITNSKKKKEDHGANKEAGNTYTLDSGTTCQEVPHYHSGEETPIIFQVNPVNPTVNYQKRKKKTMSRIKRQETPIYTLDSGTTCQEVPHYHSGEETPYTLDSGKTCQEYPTVNYQKRKKKTMSRIKRQETPILWIQVQPVKRCLIITRARKHLYSGFR